MSPSETKGFISEFLMELYGAEEEEAASGFGHTDNAFHEICW